MDCGDSVVPSRVHRKEWPLKLRIHRTWKWQVVPDANPRIGGPPPPMELVPNDQLEIGIPAGIDVNGQVIYRWEPIEVVEEPKPEHPLFIKEREYLEQRSKEVRERIHSQITGVFCAQIKSITDATEKKETK